MNESWSVVCATAHREFEPDVEPWVRERLTAGAVWLRDHCGTRVGVSGMALGGDQWWAEAVLDAGLELHAYVPFRSQSDRWPFVDRERWCRLVATAARVVVVGGSNPADRMTAVRLLHARNDAMLAAASAVVAVLCSDATRGGTLSATRKAQRLGLPGVHLDPVTRRTRIVEPGRWFEQQEAPALF